MPGNFWNQARVVKNDATQMTEHLLVKFGGTGLNLKASSVSRIPVGGAIRPNASKELSSSTVMNWLSDS
jgi:hypothetical protein